MAIPARTNPDTSHDLAVIAVRVLDDARMTWVAEEVESEHALRAWSDADAPQAAGAYLAYRAAVDREEAAARDLQRLSELTQPCQERLAPKPIAPRSAPRDYEVSGAGLRVA
ncbi:MAG: hypothetical protein WBP81_29050 [Solirubrobacteraceae bacterium]